MEYTNLSSALTPLLLHRRNVIKSKKVKVLGSYKMVLNN